MRISFVVLIVCVGLAAPLHAEQQHRTGLGIGASLGAGVLDAGCEDCGGVGPALAIQVGWFFSPRFGLLYDASAVARGDAFGSEMGLHMVGAAQFFVTDRAWVKAGAGVARLELREGAFGQDESERVGFGALVGGGFEFHRSNNIGLEVRSQLASGFYSSDRSTSVSISLGAMWR